MAKKMNMNDRLKIVRAKLSGLKYCSELLTKDISELEKFLNNTIRLSRKVSNKKHAA